MTRSVAGFRFGAVAAGLKASGRPDFALLLAESEVPLAAVFTRSRVKGAPVVLSQERGKSGLCRGVVVHAGIANAFTGRAGLEDEQEVVRAVAEATGADERRLLAAGTGIVGVRLPVPRLANLADDLAATVHQSGFGEFAEAILTTDRGVKTAYAEVGLGRIKVRLLACAKGGVMVAPNLATTLAFVVTDAAVDLRWLRGALREEVDATFNDLSVDGESSTNDSLFLFASGRAENRAIDGGPPGRGFRAALRDVLEELAHEIVADGKSGRRVVTFEVAGAPEVKVARHVARRIASSLLVKTALHGATPDVGRIVVALGNAGIDVDPERLDVDFGNVHVVRNGAVGGGEVLERAAQVMQKERYTIRVHLHAGHAEGRHVTCDLSPEDVAASANPRV